MNEEVYMGRVNVDNWPLGEQVMIGIERVES